MKKLNSFPRAYPPFQYLYSLLYKYKKKKLIGQVHTHNGDQVCVRLLALHLLMAQQAVCKQYHVEKLPLWHLLHLGSQP